MKYHYEIGAVRWYKHDGKTDVRGVKKHQGWKASADMFEYHPITGKEFKYSQWWIREEFVGY